MLHFSKILVILFFLVPHFSLAKQYITPAKIEKNYKVPSHKAQANILLKRFSLLEERARKLSEGKNISHDVDGLLKNLFLPENLQQFRRTYSREISLARNSRNANSWLSLAHHYNNKQKYSDAITAAYMAYILEKNTNRKANALTLMGELYVAMGKLSDGLNIMNVSLRLDHKADTERRIKVIEERFFLTIRDISVNVEQASPNACIVFSKKLKPRQHAEDYVSLTNESDIDIHVQGNQICFNGLEYGKTYEVKIRKGLKGENKTLLDHDSIRKFTVQDREKRASFEVGSYVISRTKDNVVPLTTVNISNLKLSLYLINDRNLIHSMEYSFLDKLNGYSSDTIKNENGSLIWQGDIDISGTKNKETKTLLPLNDMIKKTENGLYILVAEEPKTKGENSWRQRQKPRATQWLLVSNMGMMTFKGKDGLHVMVRSLQSAAPLKKVSVNLVARNNKILGTVKTNKQGFAHFPMGLIRGKGGDTPVMVTANGRGQDYNFLNLAHSYLDLSERGVSGRNSPGKQDAFLYTDRGVYRPGETVKFSALLRTPESQAIGDLPLTFKVTKPDGSTLMEHNITGDNLGGYGFDIPISSAAQPGRYSVQAYLTTPSNVLGTVSFQIEDFVPQRIRARLSVDKEWLEAGTKTEFNLKANFLYGPPAADLKSEAHISLKYNPRPFVDYRDFRFGLVEEDFYNKTLPTQTLKTDQNGMSAIPVELDDIPDTSQPLLAYIQAFVFDVSGRPVDAKLAVPLRQRDVEVGLKRSFTGTLSAGDKVPFETIALDKKGIPLTNRVISYELIKEDYYYSWYRSGNYWDSRRNITETIIETGEVTTDSNGRATINTIAQDGRFRLNILDKEGSSAASNRFYVGWWSHGSMPNVPDELELSLKENDVKDGGILKAFVKAPFAGKATIMIMNDQLRFTRDISLPAEGREIALKVDRDWGPGAYLSVTAFRPEAGKPSKLPVRSMNLAWFTIDKATRSTKVNIDTPDTVLPRQKVTLPVSLTGQDIKNQKIRLTIAAVDEGILGLTKFKSPNPIGHFLSQRRLGMQLADLYGRLIKPVDGVRGKLRTGGDLARMEMASIGKLNLPDKNESSDENASGVQTKTVKTVALYQRNIDIDHNGKGEVTLDLPDFNGRLRLMVVAYGDDVVGQGDQELIVRDPVVADLLLPRFLAPGDHAETTLSVHNLSGKKRTFSIDLAHTDGLDLGDQKSLSVTLDHNKRFEKNISITAHNVGKSKLSLIVKSDGLPDIARHWNIAVRPAQAYVTKRQVSYLSTNDHEVISREDINGFLPKTISANLTITDRPDFNVPDLMDNLYLYPYGCGEQTTSRALPMLYYGDVASQWNKEYDPLKMRRIIDKAILHLLDLQRHDGSFALWRSTGEAHTWLTAYIFEFLSRAREQKMDVPAAAYEHARTWLNSFVNQRGTSTPHIMAYAHYVLARIGDITPSKVRYFADLHGDKIGTKIGLGHLAAALNLIGEKELSEHFFEKALKKQRNTGKKWHWYKDFGSDLRDGAALAALISEASIGTDRQLRVAEALDREYDRRKYFSTQEQAWLLLATHNMTKQSGDGFQVTLNDKPLPKSITPLRYSLKATAILNGFDIENTGETPVRAIQSIRAVPSDPQKPTSNGFQISRTFVTLDGKPVDLNSIKQNDLLIVIIQGRSQNNIDHEGLIVDMLPAGFEIENSAIGGYESNDNDHKSFLPRKSAFLYEAARDDRYVAAMNLGQYRREFSTSYIVRAVTPGTYVLPAVFVEDMYKPQYHARGSVGKVTISK